MPYWLPLIWYFSCKSPITLNDFPVEMFSRLIGHYCLMEAFYRLVVTSLTL